MRVLVFGSPDFGDKDYLNAVLDKIHRTKPIVKVVCAEGDCVVAAMTEEWAATCGVSYYGYDNRAQTLPLEIVMALRLYEQLPDFAVAFCPRGQTGDDIARELFLCTQVQLHVIKTWSNSDCCDFDGIAFTCDLVAIPRRVKPVLFAAGAY